MRSISASLAFIFVLAAAPSLMARQSASAAARKAKKADAQLDPSHWFATRQGLLRVYQERGHDEKASGKKSSKRLAKNSAPDADATPASDDPEAAEKTPAPPAGASCEVIESTPKDGDAAARTRESCTMIAGRMPKGGTMLTYELRDNGIFMVEAKSDGAGDPVKLDRLLLPAPARKGKSWSEKRGSTTLLRTVKSAGKSCKTAARQFGDCLVLGVVEREGKKTRRKYTETYAAGVGLVEDAQWELIDVKGL